jgi:acetate kinase
MNILVLNSGSSSVKFQLIETSSELIEKDADRRLASGLIERLGSEAIITFRVEGQPPHKSTAAIRDHKLAIDKIIKWLVAKETNIPGIKTLKDIHAVGHRVVHGGEKFSGSVMIDDSVIRQLEECIELAPLHNPANLKGIYAVQELFGPGIPQCGVFDTAFHYTLPEYAYLYAIPYQLYVRHKIRRYGFHGTSHRYIAYRYRVMNNLKREDVNIITLHLGNGASACAIQGGNSVDTTMGLTPLEGLIMGTRSGDIDPAIIQFLTSKEGYSVADVESILNKQSGLLGISGLTNELRELMSEASEHEDRRAKLAIDMFCYRIKKYVGAYMACAGKTDAIVFTGGIGENAYQIRKKVCENMEHLGIKLDEKKNESVERGAEALISIPDSKVKVYVIPTNEELLIARDTARCAENIVNNNNTSV